MTPEDYRLVRQVFVRAMGLIYLAAFVTLWIQARGLVGTHGILPAGDLIDGARRFFDARSVGLDRYHLLPTLAWLSTSDAMLVAQCAAGTALALAIVVDLAPALCLALAWALYLSLTTAGQDFYSFQWDSLLLEAGLLAMIFAPWRIGWRSNADRPPSRVALWLLRWLVFRLMFESGCVKWLSGDLSWRHLTALTFHYETQPLPTWIGWYAAHLPVWAQKISCAGVFVIEGLVPFSILGPRRVRLAGAALLVGLQILILLTGNYAFFNWLTMALCLTLLDDRALLRLVPVALRGRSIGATPPAFSRPSRVHQVAAVVLAVFVVPISITQVASLGGVSLASHQPIAIDIDWMTPLRSVNSYGLFAVMTTTRDEIEIQGSDDGRTWQAYALPYKPGDVSRRPEFIAPYQPRLDWQLWFAALGTWRDNPWFPALCTRLLQGSPGVEKLFAVNPFPSHPPRYIRAELYTYRFTTMAEHRATGAWWTRTFRGDYFPAIFLRQ